jgi:hypothetical protein
LIELSDKGLEYEYGGQERRENAGEKHYDGQRRDDTQLSRVILGLECKEEEAGVPVPPREGLLFVSLARMAPLAAKLGSPLFDAERA